MHRQKQGVQQGDFARKALPLCGRQRLHAALSGFNLVRLTDHKQHLVPPGFANHLMVKVLVHRQRPVIGLDKPQHQIEMRKLLAIHRGILRITPFTFTDTGQVYQRHTTLTHVKAKAQRLTGAGRHITDRRHLTGKQRITQAALARTGLAHNADNRLVVG